MKAQNSRLQLTNTIARVPNDIQNINCDSRLKVKCQDATLKPDTSWATNKFIDTTH